MRESETVRAESVLATALAEAHEHALACYDDLLGASRVERGVYGGLLLLLLVGAAAMARLVANAGGGGVAVMAVFGLTAVCVGWPVWRDLQQARTRWRALVEARRAYVTAWAALTPRRGGGQTPCVVEPGSVH